MGQFADFFKEQNIPLAQQPRAKMLSLDAQFEEAKAERDSLRLENQNLKAQVNPLQKKVDRLEERIKENAAKPAHDLEPDAERILLLLARKQEYLTSSEIQNELGLPEPRAEYYIRELLRTDHLFEARVDELGYMLYSLGHEGNKFLVKKGRV